MAAQSPSHAPPPAIQSSPRKPRQRSSIACQACNSRRVKCNAAASAGFPCSNCQRTGRECKLIESRRGKGIRKSADGGAGASAVIARRGGVGGRDERESFALPAADEEANVEAEGDERVGFDGGSAAEEGLPGRVNVQEARGKLRSSGDTTAANSTSNEQPIRMNPDETQDIARNFGKEPEMMSAQPPHQMQTKTLLHLQSAFSIPSSRICKELFRVYFEYVQPHYPIIDRAQFIFDYAIPQSPPSWLLLQAVLFMAAAHCEEALLMEAGFGGRYDARVRLFGRVKALYDADHEKDKLTTVQAVFLMSLWWPSPTATKDPWHYLGIAINLARSLNLHRSITNISSFSSLSLRDQRVRKKIWWSLFAEDKNLAAALRRPVHIRLSDCDVETLQVADFEEDPFGFGENCYFFQPGMPTVHVGYPVFMCSLAKIVERTIEKLGQLGPVRNDNNTRELCEGMLQIWEMSLPDYLDMKPGEESVWLSMLQIAVCRARILAHQTQSLQDPFALPRDNGSQKAMTAAGKMVRIVEDLLSSGQIHHCPALIIPALFSAASMFTLKIQSDNNSVSQQLAHVKLNLCMIALRELQSSWPVAEWISLLFTKTVRRIRDEDDELGQGTVSRTNAQPISQDGPWATTAISDSSIGNSTPTPTSREGLAGPAHQSAPIPLDLSTDWSGIRDEELHFPASSPQGLYRG